MADDFGIAVMGVEGMVKGLQFFGGSRLPERIRNLPLAWRVGIPLAAIAGLALSTMVASVMIANTARNDAAVINLTGSLRMQSYRMLNLARSPSERSALAPALDRFESNLDSPIIRAALSGGNHELTDHYRTIGQHWRTRLHPLLEAGEPGMTGAVEVFVAEMDALVAQIQREAETRIRLLRLIQGTALVLMLPLILGTLYLLHSGVVLPLRELLRSADEARGGNLRARVSHTSADEIGRLGATFNRMTDNLEQLYDSLERKVDDKTRDLKRSNDALKLLYETARALASEGLDGRGLQTTVERLNAIIDSGSVALRLTHPDAAVTCRDGIGIPVSLPDHRSGASKPGIVRIPVRDRDVDYGVLLISHLSDDIPAAWKLRLADAVADQIASALTRAREARQQRRLALMEERAVIARELHDSLAQSLSYLKIQVTRLDALNRRDRGSETLIPVIGELRQGLNEAYRHLRELLITFRLRMNEPGLEPALSAAVDEFGRRGGLKIRLDMRTDSASLDANTEIHLLQIAREALANIVHHARASEAVVVLTETGDQGLLLTVDDDGIGLPEPFEKTHRYGTRIMQERAEGLGGRFGIEHRPEGGTRVWVRFPHRVPRPPLETHDT